MSILDLRRGGLCDKVGIEIMATDLELRVYIAICQLYDDYQHITVRAVARKMGVCINAVAGVITRLEKNGWLMSRDLGMSKRAGGTIKPTRRIEFFPEYVPVRPEPAI